VNPLITDPGALYEYEPGTWGPPQADQLVADIGGWNSPT
jgi:glucose-6-phosphate 1-dehydrogenase